ncbi:hypothetical protein QR680_013228 [Steinernema hermaphroditum]|uniref:ZSWIM3 N-terminal domain-containing protein n=1 Tax=Steinernema hermaphroditum TaxID=289476 RepID=A0AA39M247_9BILA|nr:hypothetical protein QR680_013228 [Steinernema hermaphroditum]
MDPHQPRPDAFDDDIENFEPPTKHAKLEDAPTEVPLAMPVLNPLQNFNPSLNANLLSKLFPNFQSLQQGFQPPADSFDSSAKTTKFEGELDGDSGIAHTPSPHNLSDDGEIPPLQIAEDAEEKAPLSPTSSENNENEAPPELAAAPFVSGLEVPSLFPSGRVYNKIVLNAYFNSYADFKRVFKEWMDSNFHPFRVASSERMTSDTSFADVFQYRYIVYHCKHYGVPRKRGQGKRPNQQYLPCGCKAMLRLNYQSSERALRLTTLVETHNGHDVNRDAYEKSLSNHRRQTTPRGSPMRVTHSPNSLLNSTLNLSALFASPTPAPPVAPSLNPAAYQQQSIAMLYALQQQTFLRQAQEMAKPLEAPGLPTPPQESPQETPLKPEPVKTESPQEPREMDVPQLARPTPTRPQNFPIGPFDGLSGFGGMELIARMMQAMQAEKERRVNSVLERLRLHLQSISDQNVFCDTLLQLESLLPPN